MARNDGVDRTTVRNQPRTESNIADAEAHNERQKACYRNEDIIPERSHLNIHFKTPSSSYQEMFRQMEQDGIISTRGLKQDAVHYGELVFDVNSAYFHNHGGYEYAKAFYAEAYRAAVDIVGGEQYILSAVMHADERNQGMSKALGYDVWHYHLHVVYVPVVEKQILWSKRCKDPALVGTVKETIMQVSHSKKWQSRPVLDEFGEPMRTKTGKIILKKSYSVLQDQYHDAMFAAGYTDVERGERGSTEEHLTTVQFKVMKEQEALDTLMAQQQSAEQAVRLAQANREEAEREVEAMKRKVDALAKNDKDVKAFVQNLGSADELLPDTGMLETAKSYRENKALPVIKKLVRKLREVYALLVNERQKNTDMLRETAYWKRKAETNEVVQEKASRLDRLTRTIGSDEIDRLLSQRSTHERSRYKAWDNSRYSPVRSYDSKQFSSLVKYTQKQGLDMTVPEVGDSFAFGDAQVQFLSPMTEYSNINDCSIVVRITHGSNTFLFTGDAEWDAEHDMVASGYDLSATVLKVGHHGSDTSSSYVFLREVMPKYAVISCGEGNSYGHPTEAVLSRLRDAGTQVFRTDLQGDIICVSDGNELTFAVEKNAD